MSPIAVNGSIVAVLCIFVIIAMVGMILVYLRHYGTNLKDANDSFIVKCMGYKFNNVVVNASVRCISRCGLMGWVMDMEAESNMGKCSVGPSTDDPAIVFYGDSEFTTWRYMNDDMKSACHANTSYINCGFGGARVCDLLKHIQMMWDSCNGINVMAVVLHVGGNDWDTRPHQDYGEDSDDDDIDELVSTFVGGVRLLCSSLLRLKPDIKISFLLTPRRPLYTDDKWEFMQRCRVGVAEFVDCIDITHIPHNEEHYRTDRAHLNEEGHSSKSSYLGPVLLPLY